MNNIQDTSARAYYGEILQTLSNRQIEVFKILERGGDWTNTELSRELNLPINSITGRIFELRKKGIVREYGRRGCRVTGRTAISWTLA